MSVTHTVLIVDDNLDLAENLREILEDEGHAVALAESGAAALARLEAGPVDLVITDLRMPGMNGVEMLGALKARWPETPVLVMTAFARDALLHEAHARGALEVMPKPVDLGILTGFVARVVAAKAPVLLLEDDDALRAELTTALQALTEVVPHPAPDLATARRLVETVRFKAAVVDLRLPDGDGLALGEALSARDRGAIPVVYITGYLPELGASLTGRSKGRAPALLEKPFPPTELVGLVEHLL